MSITRRLLMVLLVAMTSLPCAAAEVEGTRFEDTITAYGAKLVLNGAAVRKRSYFKTDAVGLYLPEKTTTASTIYKTTAPRLLRLVILRDLSSSQASRYVINEFKQAASDKEFKLLINDLGVMGGVYGSINKISKGDVIDVAWVPDRGMVVTYNGKSILDKSLSDLLFYEVYMRMYVGPHVPEDFRNGLMGGAQPTKVASAN